MNTPHTLLALSFSLLLLAPAAAQTTASAPATQPDLPWGENKAGLRLAAVVAGPARVGETLKVRLVLQNNGEQAVPLDAADKVFAWLTLAYGRDNAFITGKLELAKHLKDWPAQLPAGKTLELGTADLGTLQAYDYADQKDLLKTFFDEPSQQAPQPKPKGTLRDVLTTGQAKLQVSLFVRRDEDRLIVVKSKVATVLVAPPQLSKLTKEQREKFVADLIKQFNTDAFAAMAAHDQAVPLGKDIVPDLAAQLATGKGDTAARAWMTTTLADIGGDQAAAALVKLVNDGDPLVRYVVAYHGIKVKDDALDKAILAKAKSDDTGAFTSWALMGFMVFRGQAPEGLIDAGLESKDAKARATAASALANAASPEAVARLKKLAEDKDPRVAETAKKILKAMKQ